MTYMFIFLIPYRARTIQPFRREQLSILIQNIDTYFVKHNKEYKIFICEQNDDALFNRGKLLNVAFLESEKHFNYPKNYFHMNTDYLIDIHRDFPSEILDVKGVIDIYKPPFPLLGSACVFDPESYKTINGFPNDLIGWGGDDWAIYNRLIKCNIPIFYPEHLSNSGFIIDNFEDIPYKDSSRNEHNLFLSTRNDIKTNGLSTCEYTIKSIGEFHNENNIYHYLVDL